MSQVQNVLIHEENEKKVCVSAVLVAYRFSDFSIAIKKKPCKKGKP
jgi:hypothetical protein